MIESLHQIYAEQGGLIATRLAEFKAIKDSWQHDILFRELCFCLLTPQSKARKAWEAIQNLEQSNKLHIASAPEIAQELNIVRFKNNKANYLVALREQFYSTQQNRLLEKLASDCTAHEKRLYLVEHVKGIGLKEASHYLRNIGFYEEVCILDRHILRLLASEGVLTEMPKTLSPKRYFEIERKMIQFSAQINIPLAQLDFVIWYKQAGDIFK